MKIAFCELPDGTVPGDTSWIELSARVKAEGVELMIMNEMPLGPWLAAAPEPERERAAASVTLHREGDAALMALGARAVLTSSPVLSGERLANEAYVVEPGGARFAHQKHYFPDEPGFYEARWFSTTRPGFEPVAIGELVVGVLLCSELMFNEWARHYRRRGANLLAVPRASGSAHARWRAAAAMAAIVSGCYVVSSNRVGGDLGFGGGGFAFAPSGDLIAETSKAHPVRSLEVSLEEVARAQSAYPCYLRELPEDVLPKQGEP